MPKEKPGRMEKTTPDFAPAGDAEVDDQKKPADAAPAAKSKKAHAKAKAAAEYIAPDAPLDENPAQKRKKNPQTQNT